MARSIPIDRFPKNTPKKYSDVRPGIASGDILLCSGSGVFSRLIQKATRSVWSHVAFVLRLDSIERVMVLESVESVGVRTVPLSHYVCDYKDGKGYPGGLILARYKSFKNQANSKKLKKMSQFAVDLLGYPYDKDEILRIAGRIGMDWLGFSKKDVKRDREYICSEYAWECYKQVGIDIPYDAKGFVSPKDFVRPRDVELVAVLKVEGKR